MIPKAMLDAGFVPALQVVPKVPRIMISISGDTNQGKNGFAMSAPGPGAAVALDRGMEGYIASGHCEHPEDWIVKVVDAPLSSQLTKDEAIVYWKAFYSNYKLALSEPSIRTVILDGDADSYELQRMAEFGRIEKVPPNMYSSLNTSRRAMYARAYDSKKIFIATSRVRKEMVNVYKDDGVTPELDDRGMERRKWTGEYERVGFSDQHYLWQVQLMTMEPRITKKGKREFGARITYCKLDREVEGVELWGDDFTFEGLVTVVRPNVPREAWGFR